jgi:hypothetical protein
VAARPSDAKAGGVPSTVVYISTRRTVSRWHRPDHPGLAVPNHRQRVLNRSENLRANPGPPPRPGPCTAAPRRHPATDGSNRPKLCVTHTPVSGRVGAGEGGPWPARWSARVAGSLVPGCHRGPSDVPWLDRSRYVVLNTVFVIKRPGEPPSPCPTSREHPPGRILPGGGQVRSSTTSATNRTSTSRAVIVVPLPGDRGKPGVGQPDPCVVERPGVQCQRGRAEG